MKSKRGVWKWIAGGLAAVGALAAFGGAWLVHAQGFGGGWGGGHTMALAGILHHMDLTTDQKHQIAAILRAHKSELSQARQKMGEAGKAMLEAATDQDAKPEAVQAKLDAVADTGKQLGRAWLTVRQEAVAVLTPQQKQDLAKRQQRFLQRMETRLSEHKQDQERNLDELIDRLSR
jgi:Spy/CpxP family protein refolding chaperone